LTPAHDIPALEVRRLTVSYGARPAVWDVDAAFPAGAVSAVVGPNGSGKSTLLKAALGLVPLETGTVSVFGRPLSEARRRIAYVPQRESVDWDFPITVREVVAMGRYPRRGWFRRLTGQDDAVVAEALDRVGMTPMADRQIGRLSGGQRQRAFVARALAQQADLLVLDEPFVGIDARTEATILRILRETRDGGGSVVMVHHDLATVRSSVDRVLLMNVRVIAEGDPAEVLVPANLRRAYGEGVAAPVAEPLWAG
jgi:manganese/zinc/iron transport system ATP- binding protein